ncbi:MAG TPA: hypothetical protein VKP64_15280 [Mycobacteriales bacterium]|nr:hypothetical protein [Mycobacteriales bacterium]
MTDDDLFAAALRRTVPTPAGARLRITTCGSRLFWDLDIDRWPIDNWPEPAASALRELAELLSWFYVASTSRAAFTGAFRSCGSVYAPHACARALLNVLLSGEHGDDTEVRAAIDLVAPVVAELRAHRTHLARRRAAAAVAAALAQMRHPPACAALSISSRIATLGDRNRALVLTCDSCRGVAAVLFDGAHEPVVVDPDKLTRRTRR